MTTPPPFEAEDQTDEDFFNNLTVDDDEIGFAGSHPDDDGIARNFSNLSIGDFAESGSGTGEDEFPKLVEEPETQGIGDSEPSELTDKSALESMAEAATALTPAPDKSASESMAEAEATTALTPAPAPADTVGLPVEIIGATNGSGGGDSKVGGVAKSTGVKVVQWSAFSVDSQQSDFSGFDSNSDFLTENPDSFGSTLTTDGDPFSVSGFGSTENSAAVTTFTADIGLKSGFQTPVSDVATHTVTDITAHAQSTDVSDSQYWENMYPGWKFDSSTGQWYQIDGYDASANTNNLASGSVQDTIQENVQGVSSGFISDQQSDKSYFQQTTQSMVGTVTENFAANNVSNLNLVSQGTTEFPSHMVFDPQYPEWYYDTNMQQWLSLESYYAAVQRTPDAVQELSIASNSFVTGENNGFYGSYSGGNQYGQNTVELRDNHDARQGGSLSSFVQPNTWLPKTVSKSTSDFENTNTLQQHFNASNGFAAKENTGLGNGVVQYEPNMVQGHDNKDGTRGWSVGNYVPPKTWLPEPVNQSTISFSNDSTVHAVNKVDTQNGLHSSKPFTNNGYGSATGSSSFPSFVPAESQERTSSVGFSNNQHIENFHGSTEHATDYVDQHKGLNATAPFPGYGYHNTGDSTVVPSFVPTESQEQRNASLSNNQHTGNFHGSAEHAANYMNQQKSLNASTPFQGHGYRSTNDSSAFPSFVPAESQEHSSMSFSNDQYTGNFHASTGHAANYVDQQQSLNVSMPFPANVYGSKNESDRFPSFPPAEMMYQYTDQSKLEQRQHNMYGNQISEDYSQQQFQITNVPYSQFSNTHSDGRSSAGRPAHALVTFGFGGKLIVMRDPNSLGTKMDHGSQDDATGSVSILSLMEVLTDKISNSDATANSCDYVRALLQESFPGPLVINGKNASPKDVNKWVDEKIANCESSIMGSGKGEYLKLLLSLLKLSCQQYGKLRSPFGTDPSIEEPDAPELSVAKLFASARKNSGSLTDYGSFMHCMQSLPSEGQIQATAFEVQNLLVSGRRKDALCCAQAGQLWGPALVLASQLGEQFYVDTVRQMAHRQLISGSPLKTLCLLIAGQAADVFSAENGDSSGVAYTSNVPQRSSEIPANGMLSDWVENLAVITANRTKDDHLVIIHLGDCLWKERGEITAAHTCYLVAEENLQPYSESARFCLLGADHWRYPRTYASPEAIQITELYEYSKVLGNSQFMMLPLQPYKLVYAYMLAEVGRVADSLRYCQASLKLLKNSSRAPEVETWKSLLSSLEERIRTHQQSGFTSNLAPAKFVGKIMTSIDKSIHRMMGAPQPPLPPIPPSGGNGKENYSVVPKVGSQSSMDMPSLIPSPSVEGMNEWSGDSNKMSVHNRSISEPNFGQSPKQDSNNTNVQSKATPPGGSSRFGRIGSSLLQKTMGWVSISRSDRQAKLGETNKFYYDDKLKRWVEEGAEPPADEPALQPPPTMTSFQNGTSNFNSEGSLNTQNFAANGEPEMKPPLPSGYSSGFPNVSPGPNHFSARASGGIRSRYVDTFNKGGGTPMKLYQSPPAASFKPPPVANFFIPAAPAPFDEQIANSEAESIPKADANGETSAPVDNRGSFSPPPPIIHRFPSMDSISNSSNNAQNSGDSFSRFRASSWSGSVESERNPKDSKPNTFGAMSHRQFIPVNPSNVQRGTSPLQVNGGSDDLHEVEL